MVWWSWTCTSRSWLRQFQDTLSPIALLNRSLSSSTVWFTWTSCWNLRLRQNLMPGRSHQHETILQFRPTARWPSFSSCKTKTLDCSFRNRSVTWWSTQRKPSCTVTWWNTQKKPSYTSPVGNVCQVGKWVMFLLGFLSSSKEHHWNQDWYQAPGGKISKWAKRWARKNSRESQKVLNPLLLKWTQDGLSCQRKRPMQKCPYHLQHECVMSKCSLSHWIFWAWQRVLSVWWWWLIMPFSHDNDN